jgi:hypothetical protein
MNKSAQGEDGGRNHAEWLHGWLPFWEVRS